MACEHDFTARFEAPASAVWDLIRWDNSETLMSSGLLEDLAYDRAERTQIGCIRELRFAGSDGGRVLERLEDWRPDEMSYRYRELESAAPVVDYTGYLRIQPSRGGCVLLVSYRFVPVEMDADIVIANQTKLDAMMAEFLKSKLKAAA